MAGQYATAGNTIKASHFINSGAKAGTPSDDNGRVPVLESFSGNDRKVHPDFLPNYPILSLTADESISDRDFVFVANSDVSTYVNNDENTSHNGTEKIQTSDDKSKRFLAQTFTTPSSGKQITSISVVWQRQDAYQGDIELELQGVDGNSKPDGNVLASGKFSNTKPRDGYTRKGTVTLNYSHTPGNQYAIVFKDSGNSFPSSGDYIAWAGTTGDSYSGGIAYETTDGGSTWNTASSVTDFLFDVQIQQADAGEIIKTDTSLTPQTAPYGVALGSVNAGSSQKVQFGGMLNGFTGMTAGKRQYLSTTNGGITENKDEGIPIGYALTSSILSLNVGSMVERRGVSTVNQSLLTSVNGAVLLDNEQVDALIGQHFPQSGYLQISIEAEQSGGQAGLFVGNRPILDIENLVSYATFDGDDQDGNTLSAYIPAGSWVGYRAGNNKAHTVVEFYPTSA